MKNSIKQEDLLNRVKFIMKYDNKLTLNENFLKEQIEPQRYTPPTPTLNIKPSGIKSLSDDQIIELAKKWGMKEPLIPVTYADENKKKFKVEESKKFLDQIGWPKFGIPPNVNQSFYIKNPELEQKRKKDIGYRKSKSEGFDVKSDPSYNRCLQILSDQSIIGTLPISVLEVYENSEEYCKLNYDKYVSVVTPKFELTHEGLMTVSIVTGILGILPTPAAPFLNGIALAADLMDAEMYRREGDPYMATILAGLSLIPGHQFLREIGVTKYFSKLGTEGYKTLAKKILEKTGKKSEIEIFKKATEEIIQKFDNISKLIKSKLVSLIIKGMRYKSLKFILNFLKITGKLGYGIGKILGKPIIQILGVYYTFDEIYLAVFSDDERAMEIRKYSKIQQLVNYIKENDDYFKDLMIHEAQKTLTEMVKKEPTKIVEINATEAFDESFEKWKKEKK